MKNSKDFYSVAYRETLYDFVHSCWQEAKRYISGDEVVIEAAA